MLVDVAERPSRGRSPCRIRRSEPGARRSSGSPSPAVPTSLREPAPRPIRAWDMLRRSAPATGDDPAGAPALATAGYFTGSTPTLQTHPPTWPPGGFNVAIPLPQQSLQCGEALLGRSAWFGKQAKLWQRASWAGERGRGVSRGGPERGDRRPRPARSERTNGDRLEPFPALVRMRGTVGSPRPSQAGSTRDASGESPPPVRAAGGGCGEWTQPRWPRPRRNACLGTPARCTGGPTTAVQVERPGRET